MRMFCWLIFFFLAACDVIPAQPEYLRGLLAEIERKEGHELADALQIIHERTAAGLYSQDDLAHIVRALASRVERSPDTRPEIITLLGQIGRAESVPVIMNYARATDVAVRMSACQALGWIGDERALSLLESIFAGLAASQPDSAETFMVAYAVGAIKVKRRLRTLSDGERFRVIRSTLVEEPNWLIRADIARDLERWPGNETWDLFFDSFARWPSPEAYQQRLATVLSLRYERDPTGFFLVLRKRPTQARLIGLQAIRDIASPSDMAALMEMSEADPDLRVRELATSALGRMMSR